MAMPIDDEKHYWYAIFTSFGAPVNKDEMRRQRLALYELPDYVPRKNRSNDYGFDPHEQEHETFTGMARYQRAQSVGLRVHGRHRRSHAGASRQSDKAISAYRRLLRAGIHDASDGGQPMMVLDAGRLRGGPGRRPSMALVRAGLAGHWRKPDRARRQASTAGERRQQTRVADTNSIHLPPRAGQPHLTPVTPSPGAFGADLSPMGRGDRVLLAPMNSEQRRKFSSGYRRLSTSPQRGEVASEKRERVRGPQPPQM